MKCLECNQHEAKPNSDICYVCDVCLWAGLYDTTQVQVEYENNLNPDINTIMILRNTAVKNRFFSRHEPGFEMFMGYDGRFPGRVCILYWIDHNEKRFGAMVFRYEEVSRKYQERWLCSFDDRESENWDWINRHTRWPEPHAYGVNLPV